LFQGKLKQEDPCDRIICLLARSTGRPEMFYKFLCSVCCYLFNFIIFPSGLWCSVVVEKMFLIFQKKLLL